MALLTACGGGDSGGRTTVVDAQAGDAQAPACDQCAPGIVTGTAAIGQALAGAQVSVHDDTGLLASTTTDSSGHFRIDLKGHGQAPRKALLVELVTQVAGEPVVLYNLQSEEEAQAGKRALHLTPLTTLITADVLGASPQSLLARAEIDWRRITRRALRDAHTRVQGVVQPVLDAATMPATIDLRSSAFVADGTGLDTVLDLIQVDAAQGGWTVAWKAGATQTRFFDPASPSASALPAAPARAAELQLGLQDAHAQISTLLQRLSAQFAQGMPAAGALSPYLSADFLHSGLDATDYTRLVLQRQDAPDDGGYSLVGARWDELLLVQLTDAQHAVVRFRIQARPPLGSRTETMRMVKGTAGWQLQGNGANAAIHLRHAIVLGPATLTTQTVRDLHGAQCVADARALLSGTWCSTPGGTKGLPAGGSLAFGDPAEVSFGALAIYRAGSTVAEQRQVAAAHSRLVAMPSAATQRYLLMEVDAREIAPRVARVRARGGALPSGGIELVAPTPTVNGPAFDHWTLAIDENTGWAGIPWGWCEATVEPTDCKVAWSGMRSGASLTFDLLDIDGAVIATQSVTLPPEPGMQDSRPGNPGFARFDLAATPASQPRLAQLMDDTGQAMLIDWPWLKPVGAQALHAELTLQRGDLTAAGGTEFIRRRAFLDASAEGARLAWALPARSGWGAQWLGARLTATDALGVQRTHFIAPSNPY